MFCVSKRFKELLLEIHHKPMYEQKALMDKTIEHWKQQKIIDSQQSAIGKLQTTNCKLQTEVEKIKEYLQMSGKK